VQLNYNLDHECILGCKRNLKNQDKFLQHIQEPHFLIYQSYQHPRTLVIYLEDDADIEVSKEKLSPSLVTPEIKNDSKGD
jgi:hypothetical protein